MGEIADWEIACMMDAEEYRERWGEDFPLEDADGPLRVGRHKDPVICPVCEEAAKETRTRYGIRHDCCGLWSWGGKPLVGAMTHRARKKAHEAFDKLWQEGLVERNEGYRMLADELGISEAEAHMSIMDKETASKVPAAVERIRRRIEGGTKPKVP